jgi:hypothetical protein
MFGEIDHIEYEEIKGSDGEPSGGSYGNTLVYEPPYGANGNRSIELSFFTKNMTEATVVHAYSPIYIMNDQGRTIEIV